MKYCLQYTGCLIFSLKKIVGKTRVVSYSPVFSFGKCFPGFPFNWSRTKEIKCRSCFFLFRFDWTEARITIHVLNILVLQQCYVKFTLDGCVTLSLLFCCCLFVFCFQPLTPKTQYAYSPYCSLYISLGTDKENLFYNQELSWWSFPLLSWP